MKIMSLDLKYGEITVISRDGGPLSLSGKSTVLALGTFDGVHIAHRQLLGRAVTLRDELGAQLCGAFCFAESPISFLFGVDVPQISTPEQKMELMFASGLDFVAVCDFAAFCNVGAREFVLDVLKERLGGIGAVCGFNHRFGSGGVGNSELLCELLGHKNVITIPEVKIDGVTVSSSAIRGYLADGNIEMANKMLGRRFCLCSEVLRGKRLGRTIECPTTNQRFPANSVSLKRGIYASICTTEDGQTYIGASNVGIRPSIDGAIDDHTPNCETLIADFSRDIYGQDLKIEFCHYLRGEQKFSSLDELKTAIQGDLAKAVNLLGNDK